MKKRISIVQMATKIASNEQNYKNALNLMNLAMREKPDFIVFPESLNCGFFTGENLSEFCDKNGNKTKEIFSKFARENSVNIVAGSVMNLKNDKIYNSNFVFDRAGQVVSEYDKIHTFSPAKENKIITSGKNFASFELDGVKCAVAICYDLRFCEFIKALCGAGQSVKNSEKSRADLLFIPAQWDEKRIEHWKILNFARAVENQVFLCAVNGCGKISAKNGSKRRFGGNSLLISPNGEQILKFGKTQGVKTAVIDLDEIQQIRAKIDISNDTKFVIKKDFR